MFFGIFQTIHILQIYIQIQCPFVCYSRVITRTQWNFTSTTGISARTSGRSVWSTTRSSVVRQQIHADQVCSLIQFLALGKLWHLYLMEWQNQFVTFNFQTMKTKDPNLNKCAYLCCSQETGRNTNYSAEGLHSGMYLLLPQCMNYFWPYPHLRLTS